MPGALEKGPVKEEDTPGRLASEAYESVGEMQLETSLLVCSGRQNMALSFGPELACCAVRESKKAFVRHMPKTCAS